MAESCAPGRFFKLLDKNIAIMADEKYEKTEDVQQTEEAAAEVQSQTEAETTEKTDAEKLAEAEEEIARLKDRYLRQAAEFDNFRKRTLKEKSELLLNGGEKVIASLLPVLDDLERAMDNMEKSTDVATLREGVELRNELFHKANNPAEPKNASLVRKHYAQLRSEMVEAYGKLFEKLSALNK